ncbi:ABC transporter ATP-binding protein [Mycoplasmopsis felifaucium]|uniref:ABC transporter ATP-binding protein n=1 Tax=Mycoplasmopsis felifaucium TaxID=35768 RepID=A0ABZ2RRY6_9BACT
MAKRFSRFYQFASKEERKASAKVFFRLIKEFAISPWVWILSIMAGAFIAASSTGASWLVGFIVDRFFRKPDIFDFNKFEYVDYGIFIGVLALAYVLQKVILVVQRFLLSRTSLNIGSRIRLAAYKKLQMMPLSYYEENQTGDLMSTLTNDISNMTQAMTDMIGNSITVIFSLLFIIGVLIFYSPIIAIIAVVVIPINFIPIFIIIKKNQKYFIDLQEKLGAFNAYLEEIIDAFPLVNIHQKAYEISKEFDKYNKNILSPNIKSAKRMILMYPWLHFSKVLNLVEIVGITIILKQNWTNMPGASKVTAGIIISISMYIYSISDSFNQILEIMSSLQMGMGSAIRLNRIIQLKPPVDESALNNLNLVDGEIEFKNVWFAYPSDPDNFVLKDISFKIKKGQTLALVGYTGCGKTTIAKLLSKLYLPTKGDITIDGQSIFNIKETSWRSNLDIILQDTYILQDTIKNNLNCVNSNIKDEVFYDICYKTGLDDFVHSMPQKYETTLYNNGSILSDGQKQLLSITRSMISNRPITILDEATSDMDTLSEIKIQKAINLLSNSKTLLVIAHRLSTIQNANEILVIDSGSIIERGNHKELLELNGFYNKLYHAGFEEN